MYSTTECAEGCAKTLPTIHHGHQWSPTFDQVNTTRPKGKFIAQNSRVSKPRFLPLQNQPFTIHPIFTAHSEGEISLSQGFIVSNDISLP